MGPTGGGTGMAANEQSKVSSRSMATRYRGFRGEFSDSENPGFQKKKSIALFLGGRIHHRYSFLLPYLIGGGLQRGIFPKRRVHLLRTSTHSDGMNLKRFLDNF